MTEQAEPLDVEQAAIFDRAIHDPARRGDATGDLFQALGAAAQKEAELRRAAREALRAARKNDPIPRANRNRGACKGWETRRAREAGNTFADHASRLNMIAAWIVNGQTDSASARIRRPPTEVSRDRPPKGRCGKPPTT